MLDQRILFMFHSGYISFTLDRMLSNMYGSFVCKFNQSERSLIPNRVNQLFNKNDQLTNHYGPLMKHIGDEMHPDIKSLLPFPFSYELI